MKTLFITLLTFFWFLVFATPLLAQNKLIDSLENELKVHNKKDSVRVKILNLLAFCNYRNNPPKAIDYVEHAARLSDSINDVKGKAKSFYIRGVIYTEQASFKVALENFEKAEKMYTTINDLENLAKCKNAFGVLYYYKGQLKQAIKYYKESLRLKEELGDFNNDSLLYNIGNIYTDTGAYEDAIVNFEKALNINKKNNDSQGIFNCLNSIGTVYYFQGNYPLSLRNYKASLEVAQNANDSIGIFQSYINTGNLYRMQNLNDKALNSYNNALAIKNAQHNIKNITALKNNIAGIYYDKEEYTTAITYFNESIALSREIDDDINLATALNGLGFIYIQTKDYSKALGYFKEANTILLKNDQQYDLLDSYHGMVDSYYGMKAYKLALVNAKIFTQLADDYQLLKHKKNAYSLLSKIYEKKGDYKKAFEHHQHYKELNDSLFNQENIEKITQLEYEYKYKKALDSASARELNLTNTVLTTSKSLEKTQRNLLLGIIIFLTIALLMGGVIFVLKLRHEKSKTQNIVIEQKLLRSQMTPHFIFNSLSVLQGMILNKEEGNAVSYLSKFSKLLRTILENSRYKTVALSEELSAINDYMTLQNLDVNPPYNYSLTVATAINVSRFKIPPMLIQPFIENAIEHAFPNTNADKIIDVVLACENDILVCTITDNGVGITMTHQETQKNKSSLATKITSERLEMLSKDFKMQGSVSVKNREIFGEQGTLVTLVIPYKIDLA